MSNKVNINDETISIYTDDKYCITKTIYSGTVNFIDVHLQCHLEQYLFSKLIMREGYEIITPAFEHIYCDYIRCLFYMKQLEIPENICTLFLEACNDKKEK